MKIRLFTSNPKLAFGRTCPDFGRKIGLAVLLGLGSSPLVFNQNLSGIWQGVAYQPTGGSTDCYPTTLYLTQTGNTLSGTSYTSVSGTPYFAERTNTGSRSGNTLTYRETQILQKNDAPGFDWCLTNGTLTYDPTAEKISGTLHGQTEDGRPCVDALLEVFRLQILSPLAFCQPGERTLTLSGHNVKWFSDKDLQNQIGVGNTLTRFISETTTFYVTQTSEHCQVPSPATELTVVVGNNADLAPALELTASATTCGLANGSVSTQIFGGSQPYSFQWNTGSHAKDLSQTAPGNYSLTVTDANGCSSTATAEIAASPTFEVHFSMPSVKIKNGEAVLLIPEISVAESELKSAKWFPINGLSCSECLNPIAAPNEPTRYTVSILGKNGCSAKASIEVIFEKPDNLNVFVPNVFSPDADGVNDRFAAFLSPGLTFGKMQVFDRWGELVFETHDPAQFWDGRYRGKPLASEVFIYSLEYRENWQQAERKLSGSVALIR